MPYLSYKYRIYPNKEQKQLLSKTFGCVRLVYNRCLELERDAINIGDPLMGQKDLLSFLSFVLINEYSFLKDVDFNALCHAAFNLYHAYCRYCDKKCNPPAFKSRKNQKNTFTISANCRRLIVGTDFISMPLANRIKAVVHRPLPQFSVIHSFTISQQPDDTFYCSVLFSYSRKVSHQMLDLQNSIGLDYCAKGLFTDSNGYECDAPRYNLEESKKMKRALKRLSRKVGYSGGQPSKNYLKQRKKVNRIYRKIANCRNDFLQKKSAELVSKYDLICVEGLNMNEMANRGQGFGKSTMDNAYGRFLELIDYKAHDKGKYLVRINRWFPSSQICSKCGYRQKLSLSQRVFCCPRCGLTINRDYNAAINIRREGMRLIASGAAR